MTTNTKTNTRNNMDSKAMLSRSVRLTKDSLDYLKEESDYLGIGITVHIRNILEKHISSTRVLAEILSEVPFE